MKPSDSLWVGLPREMPLYCRAVRKMTQKCHMNGPGDGGAWLSGRCAQANLADQRRQGFDGHLAHHALPVVFHGALADM